MTLLLLTFAIYVQGPEPVMVDRIAIKVNDKILTERELLNAYKTRREYILANYQGAELDRLLKDAWDEVLTAKEEEMLLYEKAVELGMAPSEDDIRARLAGIRESNGLDEVQFEEALYQQTGMTIEEYVDKMKREEAGQAVIHTQVLRQIQIDDSEVAKYYQEHREEFLVPEKYRIAEIVFLKQSEPSAAKFKAAACLNALDKGLSFEDAASQYSDSTSKENGGDLGFVQYGDFNATIEDTVRELNVGERSEVLETPNAFFIIKLLEREEARPKALEDVKVEIRRKLREPKVMGRINQFIAELKDAYLLETLVKNPPKDMQNQP